MKELLAKRMREKRESLGLTQEQLAELSGVGRATIARIETSQGKKFPLINVLDALAGSLNVSTAYLLGKTDDPAVSASTLDAKLSGVDFALNGELHDMSDNEKKDVLDFIRFKKSQRGGDKT